MSIGLPVPSTCLCPAVLQELERVRVIFTSAREQCPQAAQILVSVMFRDLVNADSLSTILPSPCWSE